MIDVCGGVDWSGFLGAFPEIFAPLASSGAAIGMRKAGYNLIK